MTKSRKINYQQVEFYKRGSSVYIVYDGKVMKRRVDNVDVKLTRDETLVFDYEFSGTGYGIVRKRKHNEVFLTEEEAQAYLDKNKPKA